MEEVAKIDLEALDLTRGRVLVHHGKGGKDRAMYISPDTHRAAGEYLQLRPRKLKWLAKKANHFFYFGLTTGLTKMEAL